MSEQAAKQNPPHVTLALLATLLLCPAVSLFAQALPVAPPTSVAAKPGGDAVKLPEFEVASIKENKSGDGSSRWMTTPDGMTMTNIALKNMIASAYGINQELISGGPAWLDSAGFDVSAKVAGEDVPGLKKLTGKQRSAMLKPLLADRFHLKAHVEQKILPVYNLEVAGGGSKLKVSTLPAFDDPKAKEPGAKVGGRFMFGPGQFTAEGIGISSLVSNLAYVVHRTVIDKTGLTGTYDFKMKYATEDDHAGGKPENGTTDPLPSIFTALEEQLGLKLQSTKGPVDTLVIDHVEKPSEN